MLGAMKIIRCDLDMGLCDQIVLPHYSYTLLMHFFVGNIKLITTGTTRFIIPLGSIASLFYGAWDSFW